MTLLEWHFINTHFIHRESLKISAWDLGFTRCYAVFEYLKMLKGKIPFFNLYMARFFNSAKELNLHVPFSKAELHNILLKLAHRNRRQNLAFRILLTGGISANAWLPQYYSQHNTIVILAEEIPKLPASWFNFGIRLKTVDYLRPLPHIKTTFYGPAISWLINARKAGYDDLLLTWEGAVLETPRSNIFVIIDGILYTPAFSILKGITRQLILEIAGKLLPAREIARLPLSWLQNAEEIFITGTTKPIVPVCSINGTINLQNPQNWKITPKLRNLLEELLQKELLR